MKRASDDNKKDLVSAKETIDKLQESVQNLELQVQGLLSEIRVKHQETMEMISGGALQSPMSQQQIAAGNYSQLMTRLMQPTSSVE